MKTLYVTRGNNIAIDTETNSVSRLDSARSAIDYIYVAPEQMHVVYECGEYKRELDVEKNDIIITFYESKFKNKIVVVKSEEWYNNIEQYEKELQEEKEKWAAKQCENSENCPSCCDCASC